MPGEFFLTNYFLFIGKKSCSGDKLLTNRKRRFCWELVLILAALRSLILFSLPRLLTRLPPTPHPASRVVSLIPVPPPTAPHLILQASLPSPFWFPFLSKSPGQQQGHPSLLVNQRKLTRMLFQSLSSSWPGQRLLRVQVLLLIGAISSQPGCHSGRGRHLPGAHPSWQRVSRSHSDASSPAQTLIPGQPWWASPGPRSASDPESQATS